MGCLPWAGDIARMSSDEIPKKLQAQMEGRRYHVLQRLVNTQLASRRTNCNLLVEEANVHNRLWHQRWWWIFVYIISFYSPSPEKSKYIHNSTQRALFILILYIFIYSSTPLGEYMTLSGTNLHQIWPHRRKWNSSAVH